MVVVSFIGEGNESNKGRPLKIEGAHLEQNIERRQTKQKAQHRKQER